MAPKSEVCSQNAAQKKRQNQQNHETLTRVKGGGNSVNQGILHEKMPA